MENCKHEWSAPVMSGKAIYNDFGVPIAGASRPVAAISCKHCGEIKSKPL